MSAQTSTTYAKPLPAIEPEAKPYWENMKSHTMKLQHCSDCGHWFYPPRSHCPGCLSSNVEWTAVSGRGKVFATCNFYQPFHRGWTQEELPYNVSVVQLEEGPRVVSNVVGCAPDEVYIDMPVQVLYVDVTEDITLAKFQPAW